MKSIKLILACMALGLLVLSAAETNGFYFWKNGSYVKYYVTDISFSDEGVSVGGLTLNVNDIDSITFRQPAAQTVVTDTLYINVLGGREPCNSFL